VELKGASIFGGWQSRYLGKREMQYWEAWDATLSVGLTTQLKPVKWLCPDCIRQQDLSETYTTETFQKLFCGIRYRSRNKLDTAKCQLAGRMGAQKAAFAGVSNWTADGLSVHQSCAADKNALTLFAQS